MAKDTNVIPSHKLLSLLNIKDLHNILIPIVIPNIEIQYSLIYGTINTNTPYIENKQMLISRNIDILLM